MTEATTHHLYEAALDYLARGWTPTPLRSKVPTQKRWTGLRPSGADCWAWWVEDNHDGVGIVCGAASGNLVVVDIEHELAEDSTRMGKVVLAAQQTGVMDLLLASFGAAAAVTPSGGRHLFFTVTDGPAPGNEKLAFRGVGTEAVLLAETRGEGGQVAAPPGEGREWIGSSGPGSSVAVTATQLTFILGSFRVLDESGIRSAPTRPAVPYTPDTTREPTVADAWTIPLMDGRITWGDVLDEGWTANGYDDEGRSLWVRPDYGDKTRAHYSAKGFERWEGGPTPVLVNHSTSVPQLPEGGQQRLTPARVWAHCFFDGDDAGALAALEAVVRDGAADPRIVRDIPTPVLEEAARIVALKANAPSIPAWEMPPEDDLFDARDYLTWIRQQALALRVSRWALLGVVLVRTACEVQPHVVLPALVGGHGSLNLFTALVGESGAGKSVAQQASEPAYLWRYSIAHLGSGEGLVDNYGKQERDKDAPEGEKGWHTVRTATSAFLVADEIDQVAGLGARTGATLLPVLRTAWSGSKLGFGYRDVTKKTEIDAHSYRLGLVAGVQPGRADTLLGDSDAGTPQRFTWMAATDPGAPDEAPPGPAGPMPFRVPRKALEGGMAKLELTVCAEARAEVDATRLATLRGQKLEESVHGHRLFNQLKVAALLGLLDGRLEVSTEDWTLARIILRHSDAVAASCKDHLAEQGKGKAAARIRSEVVARADAEDEVTETRVLKLATRMAKIVALSDGPVAIGALRKRAASKERDRVADALDVAEAHQWIVSNVDAKGGAVYSPGEKAP